MKLVFRIMGLLVALFAGQAMAAMKVNSVTLNGGASTTVTAGASITVVVSETNNGSNWGSVRVRTSVNGTTQTTCIDTPDHNGNGTYSETFTVVAPTTIGTYDVSVRANSDNACGGSSNTFTLTGGIVVVAAPTVLTAAASSITGSGATLNGTVSSNGASTAVMFDYGLSTAYGSTVTATPSPLAASVASSAVSALVSGLACGTVYHFRAKGVNSVGASTGDDASWSTLACPLPVVTSINLASSNPAVANTAVSWSVVFSTSVTGVDLTDFALLSAGGAAGASLTSVTGSGTTYTVTANTGTSSTGTLTLQLVDDDSITNSAHIALGGTGVGNGNFTGQAYTLSLPVPTLFKTASSASGVVGNVVTFTVTASNTYSVALSNVVMTDTLPAGMSYVTSVASFGSVSTSGQVITWTVPLIPANGSVQWTLAVSLVAQGLQTNTVTSPGAVSASATILVLPKARTHFRLDEPVGSWNGTAGEVLDSGGTSLKGRRVSTSTLTSTNTVVPNPSIAAQNPAVVGGFCNAGNFDGNAVITVAANPVLQYTTQLSASAWIYPTAYPSELASILSNDVNYEFHLNPNGKLYWWWNASSLTSGTTIPLNRWTHVAITMDSSTGAGRERIYINGVLDTKTQNWQGKLDSNACDFYIGGDVGSGGGCPLIPARNFKGMIDEVKLYTYELSSAEVLADMTLGRSCGGDFDHIQIEHDGSASVCTPETVVIKACLDASCSTLYPDEVTVHLSPPGWAGGDTFSFSGGVTSRQFSYGTPGNVSLSVVSAAPLPTNNVRCFVGSQETCTLDFVNASCSFDAVETNAAPHTRLFTKLAGTAFNLDVLALDSSASINPNYAGTVAVDLVDASSSACPRGSGLTPAGNITYSSTDNGRKPVVFTYAQAAANVRVRMQAGSSAPACSTDNFAIRPQQLAVTAPALNNTALTGTPKAVAGTAFTLEANAGVAGGYTGTPSVVSGLVKDHNGKAIATGTLSGSFSAGDGTKASGAAFKYLDVGNIQLGADAVVDSSFTAVDQNTDCIADSTSNTLVGGKYGCNIGSAASAKMGRWAPSHFSFVGTLTPACPAGGFTYMDQDALGVAVTLRAHASTGAAAAATDPVASRYTYTADVATNYTNLAAVTLSGDNAGVAVNVANRLVSPALPTMPNTSVWSAGQWVINDTYSFAKLGTPDGPFDAFALIPALADPDGASLLGDATTQVTNTTRLRYGRLRMQNAYGSELLALPVPLEAQYWTGTFFATNTADSCTALPMSSLVMSGYTGGLAACETHITPSGTLVLVGGRLPAPGLVLTRPGVGNQGSANLAINVSNTAAGNTCLSGTESAATAANLPWFGPNLGSHATFGIYKSPLIYRRENY